MKDALIILWRMGDVLIIHMIDEPFRADSNCLTAKLDKDAVVTLNPLFAFNNILMIFKYDIQLLPDVCRQANSFLSILSITYCESGLNSCIPLYHRPYRAIFSFFMADHFDCFLFFLKDLFRPVPFCLPIREKE